MPGAESRSEVRSGTGSEASQGRIARLGPTFFFILALVYLVVLLLLAVGREAGIWLLDELHDPIAGVLPLGVPWFGALGAVTLSLYGVFDHNDHWNPKWNYWHIARPLVGIILAIIAYFIFITLINSTGLTPRTSATTTSMSTSTTSGTTLAPTTTGNPATSATSVPGQTGGTATGPSTLLLYYVLAFIVGFREDTFRSLIKRAADVLFGPGDPGPPPAGITINPSPVQFGNVPTGAIEAATVTVTNSGTGDLKVFPANTSARGTDLSDRRDVFSLAANAVEGATISPGANASLEVQFRPESAGDYTGTLTISSNAGTHLVDLRGEAVDRPEPERAPQADRRRPARRSALGRVGRRRRGQT
jgi:hypothetical protein